MSQQTDAKRICPYLGLVNDPEARFAYHDSAHRCFAAGQRNPIPLEHQSAFCLTQRYPTCPRFVELPPELEASATTAAAAAEQEIEWITERPVRGFSFWRTALLGLGGLLVGLVLIIGLFYFSGFTAQGGSAVADVAIPPVLTPTVLPTPIPASPEPMIVDTPTPAAVAFLATPTPTATPRSDVLIYELSPEQSSIGWLTGGEERGNHFGDSYLYAGIFDEQIYNSAFQIDLSSIPRGAPIYSAVLHMTGLRDDRLAVHNDRSDAAGTWTVRLLDSEIDQNWRGHNFQDIFNASALHALSPILGAKDLAAGTTNSLALTPAQIKILENRIIDAEEPAVSFRVEGPLVGSNNLFGWDTGYGGQSRGNKVILSFEVGPPPATPPLYDYVIVTSTPTPENVMTAAAILVQITADAERVGTATPVPPNMVTPTPIPDYLVIVPTPTWENTATAQVLVALATAQALTTGTPTPLPTNAVTATSTPTETPTPTPTIPNYVLITSTPTPETVFAAATQAVAATALAQSVGTPTPLPLNWVTPIVVTETPTPVNEATAETIAALATAIAITTGTPTPTPPNMILATSTPVFETIPLILVPTAVPLAPVSPESMPPELLGKVLFLSDREGEEKVYVFDPETGQLGRLTATWPYEMALARDIWSADKQYRVFTKDAIRGESEYSPALYVYDYLYKDEWQLTKLGSGIAYNGVWSPASREIAFVSNDSADDEIWVINYDGSNTRQLTSSNEAYNAREIGKDTFIPELNKFPSWSPDGQEIVFASNRTGNMQLSVMNADGSNQRLLMGWDNWTPYSDWAPVWVKYLDPAPPADKQR